MKKGFTLIELLIVIAIIGILSSIVLASLNIARSKGSDTVVKAQLAQIRNQAEIFYDDNLAYDDDDDAGVCEVESSVAIFQKIDSDYEGEDSDQTIECNDDELYWVAEARLVSDPDQFWCVDSQGNSKQIATNFLGNDSQSVCPSS